MGARSADRCVAFPLARKTCGFFFIAAHCSGRRKWPHSPLTRTGRRGVLDGGRDGDRDGDGILGLQLLQGKLVRIDPRAHTLRMIRLGLRRILFIRRRLERLGTEKNLEQFDARQGHMVWTDRRTDGGRSNGRTDGRKRGRTAELISANSTQDQNCQGPQCLARHTTMPQGSPLCSWAKEPRRPKLSRHWRPGQLDFMLP